jgi:hypothetical protein
MRAMQGWGHIRSPQEWRTLCQEARQHYQSGHFLLIERLGAERFLDPQLMATLWQLRQDLMEEYGPDSPTATIAIDMAMMAYYNALRIQGWIGDLLLFIEHELFAEESQSQAAGTIRHAIRWVRRRGGVAATQRTTPPRV